jgi:hypothetical protein
MQDQLVFVWQQVLGKATVVEFSPVVITKLIIASKVPVILEVLTGESGILGELDGVNLDLSG